MAQLELYEAQNAIAIASTADAERYAPEMMQKARQMFNQAQRNWAGKVSPKLVVQDDPPILRSPRKPTFHSGHDVVRLGRLYHPPNRAA